jgi:transposase, IS5 family
MSESIVLRKGQSEGLSRLGVSLLYLQGTFDTSGEEIVWRRIENPYWQVFIGET